MKKYHPGIRRLFLGFAFLLVLITTSYAQQVDMATGAEAVSADQTNGALVTLNGPVITETSAGQLSQDGTIVFTLPSGWEWDTGGTDPDVTIALAPGNNAVTHLDIDFTSRTASKITFTVTQSSDIDTRKPGEATFSNFRIRPTTGVLPNSGIITNTGSTAPGGTTNYGDLGMVEGAPAKIRVETESDGTGQVVPTQNITAGTSLTVYAISRDQYNNFLENMAADEWSLQNKSSLDTSPLTPFNDSTYVVFQSDTTGAAEIRAAKSGLTSTDSGTIMVQPASPYSLFIQTQPASFIQTQPASTATAGEDFVQQPVVDVQDEYGNRVTTDNATVITASRGKGSGVLQGTTELLVRQERATFTNLKHQVANTINIDFNSSGFPKVTSTDIVVGPATPAKLLFSRQPPNGAKDDPLDPGPVVQIADEFGNYTSNPNTTIDILIDSGPGGGTVSGTTSLLTDSSAIFSDLKFNITGTYTIEASDQDNVLNSGFSDSFEIFEPGTVAKFSIKNAAASDDIQSKTAGETFSVEIRALDGTGSLVTDFDEPVVLTSNSVLTGEPDTTISFTLGTLALHDVQLTSTGELYITATKTDGSVSSNSNTFTVQPGPYSTGNSTISSDKNSIIADGTSKAVLTVQLKDEYGNNLSSNDAGNTVTLALNTGASASLSSPATDNGNGTFSATLTSSTTRETVTITGTLNGDPIDDDAPVLITEVNIWQSQGGGGPGPVAWEQGGNWSLGTVPTSDQLVVIPTNPTGAYQFPIVQSNPTIAFLEIQDGATVNVDPGYSMTILNDVTGLGRSDIQRAAHLWVGLRQLCVTSLARSASRRITLKSPSPG